MCSITAEHAAARFGLTDAGNIYGRLTNSTQDVFEKRIAALEGGVAALAMASGAAAITYTIQALATKGEHIVAQKTIYGGTSNLLAHTLPLYGIETTFVDIHDLARGGGGHSAQHQGHLHRDAGQSQQRHPGYRRHRRRLPIRTACRWSSTTPSARPI